MSALAVKDITVRFGVLVAVDNVTLSIGTRELLALIGPNGAGKTTLLNAISGFLPLHGGEVFAAQTNITGEAAHRRAAFGIKRTFQHAKLADDLSVLENVLVGASTAAYPRSLLPEWLHGPSEMANLRMQRDHAVAMLERLGLADLRNVPAGEISFGRKKLVDLARALITDPDVLLLDEPTAGLSEHEIDKLAELIARIRENTALLVVAHHMGFVNKVADRVVCLVAGREISSGTPDHVQSDPCVLAAYMGTAA